MTETRIDIRRPILLLADIGEAQTRREVLPKTDLGGFHVALDESPVPPEALDCLDTLLARAASPQA